MALRSISPGTLPMIRDRPGCDPQQPGYKRDTTPLKLTNAGQGFAKDLRGQILGGMSVTHPMSNIGVEAVEVLLIEIRKAGRISLRRLHQQPVVLPLQSFSIE